MISLSNSVNNTNIEAVENVPLAEWGLEILKFGRFTWRYATPKFFFNKNFIIPLEIKEDL